MNITELETKIKKAAVNYYNGSESISDQDYDILIAELKALDPTNQLVANGLAAADNTGRTKYKHTLITGTQAKCKDITEFANWFKNKSGHYNISAKIDGAGCVSADTIITTNFGDMTIKEAVSRNDVNQVLSYNDELGACEYRNITNKMVKETNTKWYLIKTKSGKTLKITGNDRLKMSNGCYRLVEDLKVGDKIMTI